MNPGSLSRVLILFMTAVSVAALGSGCDHCPAVKAYPVTGNGTLIESSSSTTLRDVTFDDIKFKMEPADAFDRSMLTPNVEELFGQRIRIRGYIFPTLKKRGLTQFVLVRDNLECCFGPGAALYDCIFVHMEPGQTAEFSIRPVAVEGTFRYEVFPDYDGTTRAIYRLDGEEVE